MKMVFIIPALALSLLFAYWGMEEGNTESRSVEQKAPSRTFSSPMRIKGLNYSTYDNNRLKARVTADEFEIRKRKFWRFNINPFKEAVLKNAEFHIYRQESKSSEREDLNLLSFGSDILAINKKGKSALIDKGIVTRGVIKDLVLNIYESDKLSMMVRARKANVDFRKNRVKMAYVNMEHVPSGKTIKSRSAVWNSKKKVFEIKGNYTASSSEGITKGRMINVNLDFDIAPLNYNQS